MQTAVAMPAVGSKRRMSSILASLTASASSEVGPAATEVAKKVALQGGGASRCEINPEGLGVAERRRPQASRAEETGDHSTPSSTMVGFDLRQGAGQASATEAVRVGNELGHVLSVEMRSHEFKAKKGGGLAIVAAKQDQASHISEKDPERIKVAKNITNEAMIHRWQP